MNTLDPNQAYDPQEAFTRARAVKEQYQDRLLSMPNVVGLGVGLRQVGGQRTDQVCLVVMVNRKLSPALLAPHELIPSELEGVPVDVQEVGDLHAG